MQRWQQPVRRTRRRLQGVEGHPREPDHSFPWFLTARHATSTWQYFASGQKIAEFDDNGAQPGATVTHQVNFGGLTGKQKVLAVWNIADTANAFYACIDVNAR
ncbi:lytic polysaccharide monooxygenase [Streptomyces atratus]|nr:lytic polysaccharide monooxygenase [Streptomyces atratus]WPW33335.1 lytic polysaccharide monooxygenase [Streptomyces atratus]